MSRSMYDCSFVDSSSPSPAHLSAYPFPWAENPCCKTHHNNDWLSENPLEHSMGSYLAWNCRNSKSRSSKSRSRSMYNCSSVDSTYPAMGFQLDCPLESLLVHSMSSRSGGELKQL